ncbi:hypothetical protein KGQ27_02340 [Patescibacteria group bacterium]|nr:hypothetical protein [Patescibacteria group bacterium]MDE1946405.1 hypothetical protein [Patescibacteria group bacterium]MDE2011014.1 hypothetical protein [Patescibacteria group bacterium]MDE2233037.1 hypothetical protein [Patescibacteria group bacterium]
MTRTSTIRLLKIGTIALAAILIAAYAVWRSLDYARGPEIEIISPSNGASTASSTVEITGRALRASDLSMNGAQISVDQQGKFDETVVIFPGVNFITFDSGDRFGRTAEKILEVVGR